MENYSADKIKKKLQTLSIWKGNINIKALQGGWTNDVYLITDDNKKMVAKIGGDKKDFGVIRSHEITASKAAHQAGISPKVIYYEEEILIFEYIKAKSLTPQQIREEKKLKKIINLMKIVHIDVFNYLKNPNLSLSIFQIINYKFQALKKYNSVYIDKLNDLIKDSKIFAKESRSHKIVFTHNDYYFKNILYKDNKFWLIDWEYSGFNPDILDLANLSKNIQLNAYEEDFILTEYYGLPIAPRLKNTFQAFKCLSLLNEAIWGMLAEIKSKRDFDYKSFTKEAWDTYQIEKQKFFNNFISI